MASSLSIAIQKCTGSHPLIKILRLFSWIHRTPVTHTLRPQACKLMSKMLDQCKHWHGN
jgi:hypothetical protein